MPFFHIFHIISQFSSVFSKSFHYSTYFSFIISISFHYSTYFSSILSISYHYSTCLSSIFSISFHYSTYFLPYFPNHFTIQLTFLPYFPYLFTIQLIFLPYFPNFITIQLTFLPYFPYHFTIKLTFLPYFPYLHYSTYFSSIFAISFHTLGGGRYAELTEWNGTKRVDLRFWETDTIPTKYGVSLSLSQWKVLCSATQVVDDLISRGKDGKPVDWRYHLGEDVYFIIKAPQLTKTRLKETIHKAFSHRNYGSKFVVLGYNSTYFSNKIQKGKTCYSEEQVISMLEFLIDNIFVSFRGILFQQVVGIPMGTNCAPLLADLFLYTYESELLQKLVKDKKIHDARAFNFTYRYIDDVLSINNSRFAEFLPLIYPPELEVKETTDTASSASFLDLDLEFDDSGKIRTKICDKRDDFNFKIINFPNMCSNIPASPAYGAYIS